MFILRRITSEGKESNQVLGDRYNTVYSWHEESKESFEQLVAPWPSKEEIYGFITYQNGSKVEPLYKKSDYYVMCSDGKTLDKIKS